LASGKLENNKTSNLFATFSHKSAKRPTPRKRAKKQTRKKKKERKKKTSSLVHKTPTINNNNKENKTLDRAHHLDRTPRLKERVVASKVLRKRGLARVALWL